MISDKGIDGREHGPGRSAGSPRGLEPDLFGKHEKYSMIRYVEFPAGKTVGEVMDLGQIRQLPGVGSYCIRL